MATWPSKTTSLTTCRSIKTFRALLEWVSIPCLSTSLTWMRTKGDTLINSTSTRSSSPITRGITTVHRAWSSRWSVSLTKPLLPRNSTYKRRINPMATQPLTRRLSTIVSQARSSTSQSSVSLSRRDVVTWAHLSRMPVTSLSTSSWPRDLRRKPTQSSCFHQSRTSMTKSRCAAGTQSRRCRTSLRCV